MVHWGDVFETIIALSIMGILGFFMWLWKRSIYGELQRIEKKFNIFIDDDWEKFQERVVLKIQCGDNRQMCQLRIVEKLETMTKSIDHLAKDHDMIIKLDAKVEQISERQVLLIERLDQHMNGKIK